LRQASSGLFEPRIGALVRLWGFDEAARTPRAPPPPAAVAALLARLEAAPAYDGGPWYGPAPGVAWDLGAIGKGYIVDLALDWLAHRGFPDAIVNAGGNVAVRGSRGDRPWHVGIRDPRQPPGQSVLLASLDLRDESVITHGDDQRYFEHQGRRYAHILHPRGAEPARGLRSLTVVHRDGVLADGGGAALFVAGRDGWPQLAARLNLGQVLAVDDDGVAWASGALACRLHPAADSRIEIVP
jgi:thiamine biosynthesis lipoprotein